MALLEVVEAGHSRGSDLQFEIDRVREALDRTDAVLGAPDDAFGKAESAIVTGRRWAPYLAVAVGVTFVAVAAFVMLRRRKHRDDFVDS
jgi:hypothetical protein